MATLQDFVQRVRRIKGVARFLLLRSDGRLLAHNLERPEGFSELMPLIGLGSRSIQKSMGFSRFNYFMVGRKQGENFLVFSLGSYQLGVEVAPECSGPEVADGIMELLRKTRVQSKAGHAPLSSGRRP